MSSSSSSSSSSLEATPPPSGGPHITIYLDIVSPFAYCCHHLLTQPPSPFLSTPLTIVPIFLSGIMNLSQNRPPLTVPAKGKYVSHDFARTTKRYNIPVHMPNVLPESFPVNTLFAMRSLVALQMELGMGTATAEAEWRRGFKGFMDAAWVRQEEDMASEEGVRHVLEGLFGREMAERIVDRTKNDVAVKDGLKRNTEAAVKSGAFGIPWMVVRDRKGREDVVWGVDRLGLVAEMVGVQWKGEGFSLPDGAKL